MAAIALRKEEWGGLAFAVAVHAALIAYLAMQPPKDDVVVPPQRIEVTLSDEVALQSSSPDPRSQAAPDTAPQLGEAAPIPAPPVPSMPSDVPAPPVERAAPAPAPRPVPRPAERAPERPAPRPKAEPAPPKQAAPSPPRREARTPPKQAGASRVGADFLSGVEGAAAQSGSGAPAQLTGPVRSALSAAITRQLKPKWNPPDGADADRLVTVLSWNLNKDGSLSGRPQVVRQTGVTDANRAQAERHAEQAIRAVQLAAPFDLPADYYDGWKRISSFSFDLRLSQ
jgi:outer membrane biosynthesis protein TonB